MLTLLVIVVTLFVLVATSSGLGFGYTTPSNVRLTERRILEELKRKGYLSKGTMDEVRLINRVNPGWGWKLGVLTELARMSGGFTEREWDQIFNNWNDTSYSNLVSLLQDRWMAPSIKNLV